MSRDAFPQIERDTIAAEQHREDLRIEREEGARRDARDKLREQRDLAGARAIGMLSFLIGHDEVPALHREAAAAIVKQWDDAVLAMAGGRT